MSLKLNGAVALVTGASSGIGAATAKRLAENGAAVALVARRQDRLETLVAEIEDAGGKALAVTADISVRSQAERAVATVVAHFGRLDILVNNAGLMILGPVVGAPVEEWERMLDVNVRGLLYTTNAALPHLLKAGVDDTRGIADIVNISSIAGRQAWPNFGVYNLTKFGVNGFSESLRQELASKRVRVGVLEPGAVATELESHNSRTVAAALEKRLEELEERKLLLSEKIGQVGKPRRGYEETFRTALEFLSNPWNLWTSNRLEDKRITVKLAFAGELRYHRKEGFRTPKTSLPFKALGEFLSSLEELARPERFERPTLRFVV